MHRSIKFIILTITIIHTAISKPDFIKSTRREYFIFDIVTAEMSETTVKTTRFSLGN